MVMNVNQSLFCRSDEVCTMEVKLNGYQSSELPLHWLFIRLKANWFGAQDIRLRDPI